MRAAKLLLKEGFLEECVAMTYYAMYHEVTALFRATGLKCDSHAATITLLKKVFGLDNHQLRKAKKERVAKQYYPDASLVRDEAEDLIGLAEEFIAEVDLFTDSLTSKEAQHYRERAKTILA